jgi:hypothetical protein
VPLKDTSSSPLQQKSMSSSSWRRRGEDDEDLLDRRERVLRRLSESRLPLGEAEDEVEELAERVESGRGDAEGDEARNTEVAGVAGDTGDDSTEDGAESESESSAESEFSSTNVALEKTITGAWPTESMRSTRWTSRCLKAGETEFIEKPEKKEAMRARGLEEPKRVKADMMAMVDSRMRVRKGWRPSTAFYLREFRR